jgi:AraC family transcriptional regulator of adaptative response/methylated-DNA-[protein]-cysteine methyltransferase
MDAIDTLMQDRIFYQALLDRNTEYEGVFYVGVKTTGIFCHATCPARKPKFENCIFYDTPQQALEAGFRPCKRCRPLADPHSVHDRVQVLVEAVEANPERRWRDADFREYFTDASTARRQFRQRFGMTFVEYVRSRRMGLAVQKLQAGASVIDAQIASGYGSGSGFREAFARVVGSAPKLAEDSHVLNIHWIDTRLGPMVAIADDEALVLLEFSDRAILSQEIETLKAKTAAAIVPGCPAPIQQIERELRAYFDGTLTRFQTPIRLLGTSFQQQVWAELQKIPSGETRAYIDVAAAIDHPAAVRAVAQANGANSLAIIVPCHRVIKRDGQLGGYGGGLSRKQWLLNHEQRPKV